MPLFEYLCESCGRTVESLESFSGKRLSVCDQCGGRLKRLISAPAVQFKGSGWYVSDYGRSSASRESSEGGKAEGDSSKSEAVSTGGAKDSSSKESPGGTSSATDSSSKDS